MSSESRGKSFQNKLTNPEEKRKDGESSLGEKVRGECELTKDLKGTVKTHPGERLPGPRGGGKKTVKGPRGVLPRGEGLVTGRKQSATGKSQTHWDRIHS